MRKITSFFISVLCCCLSVFAQETDKYSTIIDTMSGNYSIMTSMLDGSFIDKLLAGENVGSYYNNYTPENVNRFLEKHDAVGVMLDLYNIEGIEAVQAAYPNYFALEFLSTEYIDAYNYMIENRVSPTMIDIAPGYYTINCVYNFFVTLYDTVYYTQEEADLINASEGYKEGDDNFLTTEIIKEVNSYEEIAPVKSLRSKDYGTQGWLAWGSLQENPEFLWYIDTVMGKPGEYRLINMFRETTFDAIGQSANARLNKNDTATICFDYRDRERISSGEIVTTFNIRNSSSPIYGSNYLHTGGHYNGAGDSNWIVGWHDVAASRWYLSPIDKETAIEWLKSPAHDLRKMIGEGDRIASEVPSQIQIAKDILEVDSETGVSVTYHETSQYNERKALADALEGAVAAWQEKQYNADNIELIDDEDFQATYNALLAAYNAWESVYVNPAELRELIKQLPASALFAVGDAPGMWSSEVSFNEVVSAAEAYDKACKYTPEESAAHIEAIKNAVTNAYAAVNKVDTDKWYRLSFAIDDTSRMALFANGSSMSAANKNYSCGDVSFVEQNFELDDYLLFRFIAVTDSTYAIQHKVSGHFLRIVDYAVLSVVPSLFKLEARGNGAVVISYTDVLGDATDNNYLRLNSENKTLALCQASEVDNNSNVFFEEAGDVTELPSTDFTVISMRPGTIYSYALPVDITLPAEGVGAYTLSINNDNDDFVVTMQRINSQTVSAGTPFLLVADFDEDLLAACGGSREAAYESDNNSIVNVKLSHGTEVTTQVDNDGVLQGTFKNVNLESYSAAVPKKNGFEIQRTARISPFTAYIQYEFTMEDMKYFNGPYIKPGLDISTGISSVVEAVTQIGNIYTIDGRFVGKGNISSVNALPSGIYIVNGVKVSK